MDQAKYENLRFEMKDRVLTIEIGLPPGKDAADRQLHWELSEVWGDVDTDPDVAVAVIAGRGETFLPAVDLDAILAGAGDYEQATGLFEEARKLVFGLINCEKPIISAITGPAMGAGLAVALLADISIASEEASLIDGHVPLGVAAGDHAVMIWPLLCGMAKAKLYLLTSDPIDGRQAERLGLVSKAVPAAEVREVANQLAERLAAGPQDSIRWTKRTLNHWLTDAGPAFEASLRAEIMNMFGPDHLEAVRALKEGRPPIFVS